MSVITWGKPKKIEYSELDAVTGQPTTWSQFDNPVEGTTSLETTVGETTDAYAEGHELIDRKKSASTYELRFQLYIKRNFTKPIVDVDGVVTKNYAIRLTPEDDTLPGYLMPKCSVGCTETWSSADGGRIEYTFTALKPDDDSKMLQPYTASQGS